MRPKNPTNLSSGAKENSSSKTLNSASKDPLSKAILAEAEALGNSEMQALLKRGTQTREGLLQFLLARLGHLQGLQSREEALVNQRDRWFIPVHKGADFLPDPNRWHPCAKTFKRAALALCRGDIARGWQLLAKGVEEEKQASRNLPNAIQGLHKPTPEAPAPPQIDCTTPCDTHSAIRIADEILNRSHHVDDASTRKKALHDWFESGEEEEEDPDAP